MAEFVRAQIFGTTFEITSRLLNPALYSRHHQILTFVSDIQTCNLLVWEPLDWSGRNITHAIMCYPCPDGMVQLRQRPADGSGCRCQEDYETIQYPGLVEAHI